MSSPAPSTSVAAAAPEAVDAVAMQAALPRSLSQTSVAAHGFYLLVPVPPLLPYAAGTAPASSVGGAGAGPSSAAPFTFAQVTPAAPTALGLAFAFTPPQPVSLAQQQLRMAAAAAPLPSSFELSVAAGRQIQATVSHGDRSRNATPEPGSASTVPSGALGRRLSAAPSPVGEGDGSGGLMSGGAGFIFVSQPPGADASASGSALASLFSGQQGAKAAFASSTRGIAHGRASGPSSRRPSQDIDGSLSALPPALPRSRACTPVAHGAGVGSRAGPPLFAPGTPMPRAPEAEVPASGANTGSGPALTETGSGAGVAGDHLLSPLSLDGSFEGSPRRPPADTFPVPPAQLSLQSSPPQLAEAVAAAGVEAPLTFRAPLVPLFDREDGDRALAMLLAAAAAAASASASPPKAASGFDTDGEAFAAEHVTDAVSASAANAANAAESAAPTAAPAAMLGVADASAEAGAEAGADVDASANAGVGAAAVMVTDAAAPEAQTETDAPAPPPAQVQALAPTSFDSASAVAETEEGPAASAGDAAVQVSSPDESQLQPQQQEQQQEQLPEQQERQSEQQPPLSPSSPPPLSPLFASSLEAQPLALLPPATPSPSFLLPATSPSPTGRDDSSGADRSDAPPDPDAAPTLAPALPATPAVPPLEETAATTLAAEAAAVAEARVRDLASSLREVLSDAAQQQALDKTARIAAFLARRRLAPPATLFGPSSPAPDSGAASLLPSRQELELLQTQIDALTRQVRRQPQPVPATAAPAPAPGPSPKSRSPLMQLRPAPYDGIAGGAQAAHFASSLAAPRPSGGGGRKIVWLED